MASAACEVFTEFGSREACSFYFTIWKNNTSPEARILWTFRTPPKPPTLKEASLFAHFWVCPGPLKFMYDTHQLPRISCFLRGRVKNSKNTISIYRWHKKDSLFRDQVLFLFFRTSAKQWGELHFCGVKNASKNDESDAFWRAPRTIRRRRSGFQTGVQNHAKWR